MTKPMKIVWVDTGIRVFGKPVIGAVDEELLLKALKRKEKRNMTTKAKTKKKAIGQATRKGKAKTVTAKKRK